MYQRASQGGGDVLNPTIVHHVTNSTSASYTIDATKKYLVVGSGKLSYAGGLTSVAYIDNGTRTMLQTSSYVTITLSGTTLSMRYTGTGSGEFEVIQLD